MVNLENLKALYEQTIMPNLLSLEELRKRIMFRNLGAGAGIVFAILLPMMIYGDWSNMSGGIIFTIIAIIIACIVLFIFTYQLYRKYRGAYKTTVIAEMVKAIDPNWSYNADAMISTSDYYLSDLFREAYDKYEGDDYISGKIDKTDFECSELHTQYKSVTYDHKGRRHEQWHTIFKGLFFHADFNKNFSGCTYVMPDYAEKLFGKLGQAIQKFTGHAELVKLENPEFEKEFVVHSTDQIEARYIITPTIMEAMLRIKNKYQCPVHFSFIGTRVFCAMSFRKDLFEPRIFSSGVNFEDIERVYQLFMANETIINELNLNTRIWTKN